MAVMTPTTILPYILVPLILWRVYARVRRNIGRQRSRAWRHWTGAIFFPLLVVLIALTALARPDVEAGLFGGVAAGAALAIYGLKLTRFERTEQGFFYTPNAYLGVGLTLLFVSRVVWRMAQLYGGVDGAHAAGAQGMTLSPLTMLLFGLIAGYYTTYAAGILRWRRTAVVATPPV